MSAARLLAISAVTAAMAAGPIAGMAPAFAHVHVSSADAVRNGYALLTFSVPNESQTGSATTKLVITLPDVASARAETTPGWAITLDRDAAAGTVRAVTWTAAPGAGIPADQFGLFRLSVKLPDADVVSFPAAQSYADGTVVDWDQPPLPDGSEPEHPAPMLTLAAGPTPAHDHHAPAVTATPAAGPAAGPAGGPDNSARVLAGVALLVAALGVGIALARRRA